MKQLGTFVILVCLFTGCQIKTEPDKSEVKTICNPVNINYRFCIDKPSRREAADPTIVWFKDRYYLFASKSGGYWHSENLSEWTFVETRQIPVEEYAPTAVVIEDTIFFLASSSEKSTVYKSADPLSGEWKIAVEELEVPVWDPALFLDDDKRLYLYWGCSNTNPTYGVEIDFLNNFSFIGEPKELVQANPAEHGWEVPGDYNAIKNQEPWIEGSWINKFNGKYYLQYSGPGTEYKSYNDGVYVSENPLGPFTLQPHNPFAYKPEGFAAGAGHGSTFTDRYGNIWHIGTVTISQKHMFERRLAIYPAFCDDDGALYSVTKFGDYPLIIPDKKITCFEDIFPGLMLLSYNKVVQVSSSVDSFPAQNITDEDIRTYWAASGGNQGEYAILDLGKLYDVYAVQVNFAEHNTEIFGRQENLFHRYTIEYSNDRNSWDILIDKSENNTDNTHDYSQLADKVSCRFLKINNIEVPGGHFALSGFRVFGKGCEAVPEKVIKLEVTRNNDDRRSITLNWENSGGATGYNINFGLDENKMHQNYQVYGDTTLIINSLNAGLAYCFSVEAFNKNGITTGGTIVWAE